MICAPSSTLAQLNNVFGDKAKYFDLTPQMLYYHELMTSKVELEMTHEAFEPFVRMLWAKNIMYENYFRTNNHMFVTLGSFVGSDRIADDIRMLITLADKTEEIVVKGGEYDGVFTQERYADFLSGGERAPARVPQLDLVWGNMDAIEWLSVNVEGHLLSGVRDGIIGTSDVDYVLNPYMTNTERFKVY